MTAPSCRDCKHCTVRILTDSRLDLCKAIPPHTFYCSTERALRVTGCGPSGVNYAPKPRPWWDFWSIA